MGASHLLLKWITYLKFIIVLSDATGPSKTVFPHSYLTHSLLLCWTDLFFLLSQSLLPSSCQAILTSWALWTAIHTHTHAELPWLVHLIYLSHANHGMPRNWLFSPACVYRHEYGCWDQSKVEKGGRAYSLFSFLYSLTFVTLLILL